MWQQNKGRQVFYVFLNNVIFAHFVNGRLKSLKTLLDKPALLPGCNVAAVDPTFRNLQMSKYINIFYNFDFFKLLPPRTHLNLTDRERE